MNIAILMGRLTRDPELKYTTGGKAYANFTLAVNSIKPNIPKTTAPILLNNKCTAAALLAVLLLPTLDMTAVTHEPIFWPNVI